MLRKSVRAVLVAVIPIGYLVTVGAGTASANPVTFSGVTTCPVKVHMRITPGASTTSVGPYTVTFMGLNHPTNAACTPPLIMGGVTLKKSKETAHLTIPAGAPGAFCLGLQTNNTILPPFNSFVYDWHGPGGTITPSNVFYPNGETISPVGTITGNGSTVSGSFSTVDFSLNYLIGDVTSNTSGCNAGGGLRRLVLTGTVSTT